MHVCPLLPHHSRRYLFNQSYSLAYSALHIPHDIVSSWRRQSSKLFPRLDPCPLKLAIPLAPSRAMWRCRIFRCWLTHTLLHLWRVVIAILHKPTSLFSISFSAQVYLRVLAKYRGLSEHGLPYLVILPFTQLVYLILERPGNGTWLCSSRLIAGSTAPLCPQRVG